MSRSELYNELIMLFSSTMSLQWQSSLHLMIICIQNISLIVTTRGASILPKRHLSLWTHRKGTSDKLEHLFLIALNNMNILSATKTTTSSKLTLTIKLLLRDIYYVQQIFLLRNCFARFLMRATLSFVGEGFLCLK